ncbi:MAG: orotidine-5'-phosphate decarboxylase [Nitriliruptorales bacterium]|nr:orotidine-5'-phosphate decarboxylase [Nitriliruptorales bacterium]
MVSPADNDTTSGPAFANPLIVALDVPTLDEAVALAAAVGPHVGCLKVGLELFTAHGPAAVRAVAEHGPVFLDLKLHDIPNTVARAAGRVAELGVAFLTVHASGGPSMIESAARVLEGSGTRLLGVTVLTSLANDELATIGQPDVAEQVPRLALVASKAGADGIVCAPTDVAALRGSLPSGKLLVTPGIRPATASGDDQARIATPEDALGAGADLLVIGRPITRAEDPVAATRAILADIGLPA